MAMYTKLDGNVITGLFNVALIQLTRDAFTKLEKFVIHKQVLTENLQAYLTEKLAKLEPNLTKSAVRVTIEENKSFRDYVEDHAQEIIETDKVKKGLLEDVVISLGGIKLRREIVEGTDDDLVVRSMHDSMLQLLTEMATYVIAFHRDT
jgi:DNA mismatch repair ATPase MutS